MNTLQQRSGMSIKTKLQLLFIPALVTLAVITLVNMVSSIKSLYNGVYEAKLKDNLLSVQFVFQSFENDMFQALRRIVDNPQIVTSIKETDKEVAAVTLSDRRKLEKLDYAFAVNQEGDKIKVIARGHFLGQAQIKSDAFDTFIQNSKIKFNAESKEPQRFYAKLSEDWLTAEAGGTPPENLKGGQIALFVAQPVLLFDEPIAWIIIGNILNKNEVLRTKISSILNADTDAKTAFGLITETKNVLPLKNDLIGEDSIALNESNLKSPFLKTQSIKGQSYDLFSQSLANLNDVYVTVGSTKKELHAAINSISFSSALIVIGIAAAFAFISAIILSKILSPIGRLMKVTEEVQKGNYAARAEVVSMDEIGILTDRFNHMTQSIDRFIHEIKANVKRIETTIDEAKKIASSVTMTALSRVIQEGFQKFLPKQNRIETFFADSCFLTQSTALAKGFYQADQQNQPIKSTLTTLDKLQNSSSLLLPVKDPRTGESLAGVHIPSLDGEFQSQVRPTYEILGTNIASAVGTIMLEQAMEMIYRKSSEIRSILENISQGIFLIDSTFAIQGEYSAHLESVLHLKRQQIEGKSIFESVLNGTSLNTDQLAMIKTCLESCFGEDSLAYEMNSHILPREFNRTHGKQQDALEIDWIPIVNQDGLIQRFMITIRDVTLIKSLRAAAEANKKEITIIGQILEIPKARFDEFIESTRKILLEATDILTAKPFGTEQAKSYKRHLHTIKGNARAQNFTYLTDSFHEAETAFVEASKDLANFSAETAEAHLLNCQEAFESYVNVAVSKLGRGVEEPTAEQHQFDQVAVRMLIRAFRELNSHSVPRASALIYDVLNSSLRTFGNLIKDISKTMKTMADELNKPTPDVEVQQGGNVLIDIDAWDRMNSVFSHLMRNSLDHGFVTDPKGIIKVNIDTSDSKRILIEYQDTGDGIDIGALRSRKSDHPELNIDKLTDEQVAQLIFVSGLSTAQKLTTISGRGIGMDIVKSTIEDLNGSCKLELLSHNKKLPSRYLFKIVIELPYEHFIRQPEPNRAA